MLRFRTCIDLLPKDSCNLQKLSKKLKHLSESKPLVQRYWLNQWISDRIVDFLCVAHLLHHARATLGPREGL